MNKPKEETKVPSKKTSEEVATLHKVPLGIMKSVDSSYSLRSWQGLREELAVAESNGSLMTVPEIPDVKTSNALQYVPDKSDAFATGKSTAGETNGSLMPDKSSEDTTLREQQRSIKNSLVESDQLKESLSSARQQSKDCSEPPGNLNGHSSMEGGTASACDVLKNSDSLISMLDLVFNTGIEYSPLLDPYEKFEAVSTGEDDESSDSITAVSQILGVQGAATVKCNASVEVHVLDENGKSRKRKRSTRNNLDDATQLKQGSCSAAERSKDFSKPRRKASRQVSIKGTAASTACKSEMNDNKGVVPIGGADSGRGTPVIGYIHYFLSKAYQLLFGASPQVPVSTIPQSTSQAQDDNAQSKATRARARRMRRVWNRESLVSEDQKREQTAPYSLRRRQRRN